MGYATLYQRMVASASYVFCLLNSEILGEHFHGTSKASKGRKSHQAAVEAAMSFLAVMENKTLAVNSQLSSIRREYIAQNRIKLKSIVKRVIFCGRQGIPLRGHCDANPSIQENPLSNHGNFLALLRFRTEAGDVALKEHLRTSKGNCRYTSYAFQNQLIIICGDLIRAEILKSIRTARFFSVIADEATDSANTEQLSLSIRFVQNDAPCERFVGVLKCEAGTTGEAIANMILTQLGEWQRSFEILLNLFLPMVSCLEDIAHAAGCAWNRETQHDAQSLLASHISVSIHCSFGSYTECACFHKRT